MNDNHPVLAGQNPYKLIEKYGSLLYVYNEKIIREKCNAGVYGYLMCSNYNNRLRPAEVLVTNKGHASLIRRRDTLDDLVRNYDN